MDKGTMTMLLRREFRPNKTGQRTIPFPQVMVYGVDEQNIAASFRGHKRFELHGDPLK